MRLQLSELGRLCFFVFKPRLREWSQTILKEQSKQSVSDASQRMEAQVFSKTCASVFASTGKGKLR